MAPNNKKYEIADDLILEKDTVYDCDLKVSGNILGKDGNKYSLTVKGNISAGNITAWNISARNITAGNISAWNITADDISYYAVCWAYYNIKCKSIVGRREHARHFVLDGKVTVKRVD